MGFLYNADVSLAITKDTTYVAMGVVSGNRSDEWLANELAGYVDAWAGAMTLSDCEYSIRVIKATMDNDDSVSEYGTSTVVGILVEVDDTTNNH